MPEFRTIAVTAGGAVVLLALATRLHRMQDADDLLECAASRSRPRLKRAARIATQPGQWYVHPLLAAATSAFVLVNRPGPWTRVARPACVASFGGVAAHRAVKLLYHRLRPEIALRRGKTEAAYPSGHTTCATAVLLTSAYILAREGLVDWGAAMGGAAMLSLGTGVSRVALGWHWGTDVLGGWLAGVAVAACAAESYESLSWVRDTRVTLGDPAAKRGRD